MLTTPEMALSKIYQRRTLQSATWIQASLPVRDVGSTFQCIPIAYPLLAPSAFLASAAGTYKITVC